MNRPSVQRDQPSQRAVHGRQSPRGCSASPHPLDSRSPGPAPRAWPNTPHLQVHDTRLHCAEKRVAEGSLQPHLAPLRDLAPASRKDMELPGRTDQDSDPAFQVSDTGLSALLGDRQHHRAGLGGDAMCEACSTQPGTGTLSPPPHQAHSGSLHPQHAPRGPRPTPGSTRERQGSLGCDWTPVQRQGSDSALVSDQQRLWSCPRRATGWKGDQPMGQGPLPTERPTNISSPQGRPAGRQLEPKTTRPRPRRTASDTLHRLVLPEHG